MTSTIEPVPDRIDQQQLAQQLVEAARADGVELVGLGGLLSGLTKTVLETALKAEVSVERAWRALQNSPSFADISYGAKTLARNVFQPSELPLVVLENAHNGGILNPVALTLVEYCRPGAEGSLREIALRNSPQLSDAERAMITKAPVEQVEQNVSPYLISDNITDFAQVAIHLP